MSTRPSLDELGRYHGAGVTADQLAVSYGVSVSTAKAWLVEYRASVGQSKAQKATKKRRKRSRADCDREADALLDLALANLQDVVLWSGSASDKAKHTRLCLEVRDAFLAAGQLAGGDAEVVDRPELLERVRKATASAAKLRVVPDATG